MKIAKALWIVTSVAALLIAIFGFDGKPNSDIGVFLAWSMLALSFPSGLLVSLAHVVLYDGLSINIQTSYVSLSVDWLAWFLLGYVQWFKLLPYLTTRVRGARRQDTQSTGVV